MPREKLNELWIPQPNEVFPCRSLVNDPSRQMTPAIPQVVQPEPDDGQAADSGAASERSLDPLCCRPLRWW